ncbi:hypothetical protein BY458DRAFT_541866 [Sporodiniella umbellata]|nr:hypothetical protein BY458DRAFT_541866 [Sporodiniella umbellata]
MRSLSFPFVNKKFDDQYTFELQGYLSMNDFNSTFHLLNQSVSNHPPPGNKAVWMISLWILWTLSMTANYILWDNYKASGGLIALPLFMSLLTLLFLWRHRLMRQKFEKSVTQICTRINATENIRGINYIFNKNGFNVLNSTRKLYFTTGTLLKPYYSIVIEFDDRFSALSSQQYNRHSSLDFVTIPLCAHINHTKGERYGLFRDSQTHEYDEKVIIP